MNILFRGQKGPKGGLKVWMGIRRVIKRRQKCGKGKIKNKASEEEKQEENWIGVLHSINRITQKVDIKIPGECDNNNQRGEGTRRCK